MEQLKSTPEKDGDHLIVLLDRPDDISEIATDVPSGSLIVSTVELPSRVARQSIESVAIPSSPAALSELLRARETDVLLLSERRLLTRDCLTALRAGLTADSECATVSVDEKSTRREAALPPPGVVNPRPGAVLARRDHLMLALDEAEYTAGGEAPPSHPTAEDGLIGHVLTVLARPGFLHRAVAPAAEAPPRPPVPRGAVAAPFAADVVLDGRSLDRPISGTQVQLFGLAGGLARSGARVAVMRPQELHPSVISAVARLAKDVEFVERSQVGRPAVFHRPFQTWSLHDVADCLSIGERLVLTHQDMILDRTPAYA